MFGSAVLPSGGVTVPSGQVSSTMPAANSQVNSSGVRTPRSTSQSNSRSARLLLSRPDVMGLLAKPPTPKPSTPTVVTPPWSRNPRHPLSAGPHAGGHATAAPALSAGPHAGGHAAATPALSAGPHAGGHATAAPALSAGPHAGGHAAATPALSAARPILWECIADMEPQH